MSNISSGKRVLNIVSHFCYLKFIKCKTVDALFDILPAQKHGALRHNQVKKKPSLTEGWMGGLSTRDRDLITTKTQRNNNSEYPLDRSANPYAWCNRIRVIAFCQCECFFVS